MHASDKAQPNTAWYWIIQVRSISPSCSRGLRLPWLMPSLPTAKALYTSSLTVWLTLFLVQPRVFVLKSYNQSKRGGDLRKTCWKVQSSSSAIGSVVTNSLPEDRPNFLKWIQQLTGLGSFGILLPGDKICSRFGRATDRLTGRACLKWRQCLSWIWGAATSFPWRRGFK